jgi:PAS domain S-box-containing protein
MADSAGSGLAVATVGVSTTVGESVAPAAADLLLVAADRLHDVESRDTPVVAVDDWPGEAGVAAVEAGLAVDWLPAGLLESEPATARDRLRSLADEAGNTAEPTDGAENTAEPTDKAENTAEPTDKAENAAEQADGTETRAEPPDETVTGGDTVPDPTHLQGYDRLFEVVEDGVAAFDPDERRLVDANQSYLDALGYETLAAVRERGLDGLSASAAYTGERAWELIERVATTGEPETVEWQVEAADGETLWLEATLVRATVDGERLVFSLQRDVTERERRRRAYEQIFEGVQDAIAILDPETLEIVDANEAYLSLVGYDTLDAVREQGVEGLNDADAGFTREDTARVTGRVIERGEPEVVDWALETGDGSVRWVEIKVTPATLDGRRVVIAVHRDVTDRRRRETAIRALANASEEMQTAATPTEVATVAVETATAVTGLSAAVCWLDDPDGAGLEVAAATDGVDPESFPPEQIAYDLFQRAEPVQAARGPIGPFETAVTLPLGARGLLVAGSDADRATDGETATTEDTTVGETATVDETVLELAQALADHVTTALARVARERAVRESERRFRLIADRIDEVIYLAEPDFSEVSYVNPAYEDVWGRSVAELYEDPTAFVDGIDERDRAAFEETFERLRRDVRAGDPDDRYDFEFRVRRPDGDVRWIAARGYTVELSAGERRYVGVADDVTERRRREQRLEVFNRVLRHNLRNHLDVVRAHAEQLAADETGDARHAARILETAERLDSMGERARAVDRIVARAFDPEPIAVAGLVEDTLEELPIREGVTVETAVPDVSVVTDRDAFRAAVAAALDNAVEYADSRVRITASWVAGADDTTRAGESGGGRQAIRVTISDDGPGIPDAELATLRSGTETELRHGRGLGLWQLRWGVDELNGTLAFDTDDGTTVEITVPHRGGE